MVKINLLAEGKRPVIARKIEAAAAAAARRERGNTCCCSLTSSSGCCLGGVWYYLLEQKIKRKDAEIAAAQKEVDELQQVIKEVEEYKAKRTSSTRKVQIINDLKNNQRGPVQIMDEVSRALPELIWLIEHGRHAERRSTSAARRSTCRRWRTSSRTSTGSSRSASRSCRTRRAPAARARYKLATSIGSDTRSPRSRARRRAAPGRRVRRRRRGAVATAQAAKAANRGRSGVTPWRSRPDSKASPGGTALLAGAFVGGALRRRASGTSWRSRAYDRDDAQDRKLAELQAKITEGRAAKEKLPQFREEVRRLELELEKLLRILPARRNTPELPAPDPPVDRAGRLRPPALHAGQLRRPRVLQRVADHGQPDRDATTTWRCSSTGSAGSRASSTSTT